MYEDTFLKGEGIGEKLTPVHYKGKLPYIVLVYPHLPVPTKGVFSRMKLPGREEILTRCAQLNKIILNLEQGSPLPCYKQLLFNRLEESVLPFEYAVRKALEDLKKTRATVCRMSGSGSTVFALVENNIQAQEVATAMQGPKCNVYVTTFYERTHANYGSENKHNG
jgi:4-diphosphocytidyl-2C-methyl-D-erythritol kinase